MELGKFASDDFEVEVPYGAPEDNAFVTLRYISVEKTREIQAKATKITPDRATHQMISKLDDAKFAKLWGEWSVVGWRGFEYDGQEYPFTPENRDALMAGHRKFRKFVFDVADDVEELTRIEREKIRGN
jgi:hypothetical protein